MLYVLFLAVIKKDWLAIQFSVSSDYSCVRVIRKEEEGREGELPATTSDSLDISHQESQRFAFQGLVCFYSSSHISFSLIVTNVLPAYFLHSSGIMSIASW